MAEPSDSKASIWLVAGSAIGITVLCFGGLVVFFWQQLSPVEKAQLMELAEHHFIYLFSAVVLILAGFGIALDGIIHIYVLPVRRLAEETALMHSVNPSHRIETVGSQDVKQLTRIINDWGSRFEALQKDVQARIAASQADIEREKNILAAFMAELPQGILVCNVEGRILLYNRRAKALFTEGASTAGGVPEDTLIGLGRSIFRIIDKNLIVHALDEIAEKSTRREANVAAYFVVAGSGHTLLKAEALPINNHLDRLTGFVLLLQDITEHLERDNRGDLMLRSLVTGVRSSAGGLRSAIETVMAYPDMTPEQLARFREIIHKESLALGRLVDEAEAEFPKRTTYQWPLVSMLAKDLVKTVARKAEDKLGIQLQTDDPPDNWWVQVDSYSIVLAVLFALQRLVELSGCRIFACRLARDDRYINLDIHWTGTPLMIETLRRWDAEVLSVADEGIPLTLQEVLRHHDAGIWSSSSQQERTEAHIRFFFPAGRSPEADAIRNITILTEESRPVFYDFDLFGQPEQITELDDRPLSELAFSVIDTETTGLNPRGGDEIVSIGAVRIINGRLLHEEYFDQLVDPQCPVPPESTRIHGLTPGMLEGQPTITEVLPRFFRFCENTVLVAHNAAFDMLMLQLKEADTGIRFLNPVLDTLLLSDLLMPAHKKHDIEAIARRLGISIVGRHTALGDALATAEIFLKMIPLLSQKGVVTLRDALAASRKSRYHRLKY